MKRLKVINGELYHLLTPTGEPLLVVDYNLYNLKAINITYKPYADNNEFTKNVFLRDITKEEVLLILEFLIMKERSE